MKITVLDAFGLNQGDLNFKEFEKFGEVVCYDITPQEEVVARSRGSEVLFTNKTKITAEMSSDSPFILTLPRRKPSAIITNSAK